MLRRFFHHPASIIGMLLLVMFTGLAARPGIDPVPAAPPPPGSFPEVLRKSIERHLGRPYVWGATGLKSFDCSGFVWRVLADSGILFKRTTARRLYLCLPPVAAGSEREFGSIVFFDNLGHCGITAGPDHFYHAQCTKGTNLSPFKPFWYPKICGFRQIPRPAVPPETAPPPSGSSQTAGRH